jgi:DNA damage-binding protein 1
MSKYNYIVTACKPGGVSDAFTTSFTGNDSSSLNLVVARCDMFSVFAVLPEGLQKTMDVPVNGKIEFIRPLHFRGRAADSLLIVTAKETMCVLDYDVASQSMVTRLTGSLSSSGNRPPTEIKGCLDPECRVAVVWASDGLLTVVPLDATGNYKDKTKYECYSLRLDELWVKDMQFLHGQDAPTLAVLYEDGKQKRHVKTYVINLKEKELQKGPWSQPNAESGASRLHALPRACGGVLVFGDQSIAHLKGDAKEAAVALSMKPCIINCTAVIEETVDGCKYHPHP